MVLNPEEGDYLAKELEEVFGVPYIESEAPIGVRGTKNFLVKLGSYLNISDRVHDYIEKAESGISENFTGNLLEDRKVFVDASLSKVYGYGRLLTKLGGTVVGFSSPFVDLDNRKQLKRFDFLQKGTIAIIGNGQQFEKANELAKNEIDIYFSETAGNSFVTDEGAIVVSARNRVTYGFEGVDVIISSIQRALRLKGKNTGSSSYKDSFKRKSGNWYVKQEVS